MKVLILARHAKSDWGHPDLADFDRPLNARGMRDAPAMGRRLAARGPLPTMIVSSPAVRAAATASAYADAFGAACELRHDARLYAASARTILAVASALPRAVEVGMLVGHNPGMSEAASELCGDYLELTTAASVTVTADIDDWNEIETAAWSCVGALRPGG